jgi:16S rRNA (guanine(966)-N(2))-methyltransferase RsmD
MDDEVRVRVIAGALKGRRLRTPAWPGLRPTSDRLRETVFDILSDRVRDARVLDAYAGTGALGIEALSRGARTTTFVESDRRAAALIAENAAHCGIADRCVIIRTTLDRAVASLRGSEPFDIVLLDPPYALGDEPDAILLSVAGLLAGDGILVLEHSRRGSPPDASGPLIRTRTVVAGDSALSWYRLRQPALPTG